MNGETSAENGDRQRWKWAASILGLLTLIVLVYIQRDELDDVIGEVPIETIAALVALHWLALLFRAYAWNLSLAKTGRMVPSGELHAASSLRYLADTLVPTYVGAFVRVGLLKALLGEEAPTVDQMLAADWVLLLIEAVIVAAAVIILAPVLGVSLLWIGVIVLGAIAAVLLTRAAKQRWADRGFVKTLEIVEDRDHVGPIALLLAGVLIIQPIRFWLTLRAVGLDASLVDGALTFVIASIFGALPLGPGPASLGATASLFANAGAPIATAVGVIMAGTATVAATLYSAVAAAAFGFSKVTRGLAKMRAADRGHQET